MCFFHCKYFYSNSNYFSILLDFPVVLPSYVELLEAEMALMLSAVLLQELELGFNKLSDNNIELRKEKSKLEAQLKARAEERAALEKEMAKQKIDANKTEQDLKKKSVSSLPRWSPVQENIIVNHSSNVFVCFLHRRTAPGY